MSEHPVSRDSQRVPLEARVQLKFEWFGGFISEYSSNISPGGMFIRTQTPEPMGRMIGFELRLGDDFELIRGTGEVVWVRPIDQGPDKPAGMGIRFLEISPEGRELIYRMVDNYIAEGGIPFDLSRTPTGTHDEAAPIPPAAPAAPEIAPAPPPHPFPELVEPPQLAPLPPLAALAPPPWPAEEMAPEPSPEPVWTEPEPVWPEPAPVWPAPAPPSPLPPPGIPTFGVAAAAEPPRRSRLVLWAALGGALVLATALAILNQDALTGLFLPGRGTAPAGPPLRRQVPPAAPTPPAPVTATPGPATAVSPPASPAPATSPAPAALAPPPAATAPSPAAAPEAVSPSTFRTIEKITWQQTPDGTEVVLWADGALRRQDWTSYRIDADPPRELVKLFGVDRPFPSPRLVVGTRQLLQVRTGSHAGPQGNELHVVLDLTGPGVEVTGIEAEGRQLHIHLKGK
ncbi:MAG TPA: TIGR02266 family protein [Thermoanaerobaculia bacterium]|nr:TIGR02266 family protein [Thermoanaerobaculia bacterium]